MKYDLAKILSMTYDLAKKIKYGVWFTNWVLGMILVKKNKYEVWFGQKIKYEVLFGPKTLFTMLFSMTAKM